LASLGGEAVIAGCTEVPLVMNQGDIRLPFIDSTERLAQAVIDIAYGARGLPDL
jgi:aspartate racemase